MYQANDIEAHADQINNWIVKNRYEIENVMTDCNWLNMYADSIRAYNLDFSEALRQSVTEDDFNQGAFLGKAHSLFGDKSLTWD